MKKRGTAILIAIFLITAIGTLAFSFGRILLLETSSLSLYENGVGAYYAAESGIEEGLLRYRFYPESEVPFDNWTLGQKKVYRTNLTDKSMAQAGLPLSYTIDKEEQISDDSKQIYDLRMGYVGTMGDHSGFYFGEDINGDGRLDPNSDIDSSLYGINNPALLVNKDSSLNVTIPKMLDLSGNSLNLSVVFDGLTASDQNSVLEIKAAVKKMSMNRVVEYKKMLAYNSTSARTLIFGAADDYIPPTQTGTTVSGNRFVKVADLLGSLGFFYEINSEIELTFRPLYNNIKVGLANANCINGQSATCLGTKTTTLPGPVTKITSTGYYGGTTRTLEANIDRQSGTLYDLFDYVIYRARP